MVAVYEIGQPCRAGSRRDQRIQPVFIHDCIDTFGAGQLMILFDGVEICLLGERSFRLSFHEQVLAEVRHLFLSILFVELNNLF